MTAPNDESETLMTSTNGHRSHLAVATPGEAPDTEPAGYDPSMRIPISLSAMLPNGKCFTIEEDSTLGAVEEDLHDAALELGIAYRAIVHKLFCTDTAPDHADTD